MVEDDLCWASCVSARGHLLPEFCAWEIIYLVSYDFVFPCVNIWEAQLMFCAELRQLQPSAQLCIPGPLSPAMPLPRAKGEIPLNHHSETWPALPTALSNPTPGPWDWMCFWGTPTKASCDEITLPAVPGWFLQLFQGLKMCRGDFSAVPVVPLQLCRGERGLQLSSAGFYSYCKEISSCPQKCWRRAP